MLLGYISAFSKKCDFRQAKKLHPLPAESEATRLGKFTPGRRIITSYGGGIWAFFLSSMGLYPQKKLLQRKPPCLGRPLDDRYSCNGSFPESHNTGPIISGPERRNSHGTQEPIEPRSKFTHPSSFWICSLSHYITCRNAYSRSLSAGKTHTPLASSNPSGPSDGPAKWRRKSLRCV